MHKIISSVFSHILKNGYEYETSPYGPRKDPISGIDSIHNGVDIISYKYGTDYIIAFEDGIVEELRDSIPGEDNINCSGNYIYIKHNDNYQTRYFHLKQASLAVTIGQAVKKGDVIAFMGNTGYCTGNHLHFEVRLDGTAQDPLPYMKGTKNILSGIRPVVVDNFSETENTESITFKKDDIIRIKSGAKWYGGQTIPEWVMNDNWIIFQDQDKDKVFLDSNIAKNQNIMSPINVSYLIKI